MGFDFIDWCLLSVLFSFPWEDEFSCQFLKNEDHLIDYVSLFYRKLSLDFILFFGSFLILSKTQRILVMYMRYTCNCSSVVGILPFWYW